MVTATASSSVTVSATGWRWHGSLEVAQFLEVARFFREVFEWELP
jgi:hypothetical protein